MACTRKKQCLYGDICPTGRSDEYNLIDASCYKPLEQTNEEWFDGLSTWEKANVIAHKFFGGDEDECQKMYYYFGNWLKEKHNGIQQG